MLTSVQLYAMLKECQKNMLESDAWYRQLSLGNDSMDFSVDLKDTEWAEDGIYKLDVLWSEQSINVYVDLDYFSYDNTSDNLLLSCMSYDILESAKRSVGSTMFYIHYYIVSTKLAKLNNITEFNYSHSSFMIRNIMGRFVNFDTEVDFGTHICLTNSVLDWRTVKRFRDSTFACESIRLSYDHYKEALNRNVKFNKCRLYDLLFDMRDENAQDKISEVFAYYKDHGHNSDVYVDIIVYVGDFDDNYIGAWLEELCGALYDKYYEKVKFAHHDLQLKISSEKPTRETMYLGDELYTVESANTKQYEHVKHLWDAFALVE